MAKKQPVVAKATKATKTTKEKREPVALKGWTDTNTNVAVLTHLNAVFNITPVENRVKGVIVAAMNRINAMGAKSGERAVKAKERLQKRLAKLLEEAAELGVSLDQPK